MAPEYLQHVLTTSPLVQLYRQYPQHMRLHVLLHNPEVQMTNTTTTTTKNKDEAATTTYMQHVLSTAFDVLQQHSTTTSSISGYGIASNGMSLPEPHPLHLSWSRHIQPALVALSSSSNFSVVQLPMNVLEPRGISVARHIRQDAPKVQMVAMRPLTGYPETGGTGTAPPILLTDYLIDNNNDNNNTTTTPKLWTNQLSGVPLHYQTALQAAMAHFDATELVQAKISGETLTAEQRETLDGCRLMQSLLHDMDAGLSSHAPSLAVHEAFLTRQVIPLIHDTFEAYDSDTALVLEHFFASYSAAVRAVVAHKTRELVQEQVSVLRNTKTGGSGSSSSVDQQKRLQEIALEYLLQEEAVDTVVVGATTREQVQDTAEIVSRYSSNTRHVRW